MKPTEFIKEVHDTLLSAGVHAKLSFSGEGAKIETSFGNASIKWQKTEDGFVINDFDRINFVLEAKSIVSSKTKATNKHLIEFLNKELKETSKNKPND